MPRNVSKEMLINGRIYVKHAISTDSFDDEDYFDDPNLEDDAGQIEDDSPYPEVRCAVSNVDDPEMPARCVYAILFSGNIKTLTRLCHQLALCVLG